MNLRLYNPHDNQKEIHRSKARYRVVIAGRRFGKSALALNEALARAFQLRDQIIWIVLPLFRQAKEIYWIDPDITKYFMPYVQAGLIKVDKNDLSLHVLSTNSWVRLKGSDNYDSLRGAGLDLIVWDEVADTKEDAFSAIAPALADSPNHRVLYIGTPKGLNHFHDFALRGDHKGIIPTFEKNIKANEEWQTWHFTSYDNLAWPEGSFERKQFVKYIDGQRQEMEEKGTLPFFNQEYMAQFDESAGLFFPKWSRRIHVIPPFIPSKSLIIGGMDWGYSAPFSFHLSTVVKIKYEDKYFYRVKTFFEVYGTDKTPREWVPEILKALAFYNISLKDIAWVQSDPAIFNKVQDGSISIQRQFMNESEDFRVLKEGSNDRKSGWVNMRNWMLIAPDGLPYWQVTENCTHLIKELTSAVFDDNDPEDLEGEFDHALDDQRYMLKGLKWIDARVGGVGKTQTEKKNIIGAQIDPKTGRQIGIDLDKWAKPKSRLHYK